MRFKEFIHQTAKMTPTKSGPIKAEDIVNGASFEIVKHGAQCTIEIIDASDSDNVVWKINQHGEEKNDPIEEVLAVINHSETIEQK